jgi:hypothetical protein
MRADWLLTERRWSTELPGEEDASHVRRKVQDLALQAERVARIEGKRYAAEMRDALLQAAADCPVTFREKALDPESILGVAFDETDRCRIWWSDRFAFVGGRPLR